MKRSFWQHTLATLALIVALPAAVIAQPNPTVINEIDVVVGDDADAAGYLLTEFPDTIVGTTSTAVFSIHNSGDADLEVGYLTGSAEFQVVSQPVAVANTSATVTAGSSVEFEVAYAPTESGEHTFALIIPTNAPGAEASYTVNLKGTAVTELDPQANLTAEWAAKNGVIKPLKVKLDKKTGLFKVSGQVYVYNTGEVEVALADAEIWYSADDTLDEATDEKLGTLKKPMKKIKVAKLPKPGKEIKYKKKNAKVQVIAPAAEGFIFVRTYLISPDTLELTYLDNVVSLELP